MTGNQRKRKTRGNEYGRIGRKTYGVIKEGSSEYTARKIKKKREKKEETKEVTPNRVKAKMTQWL